MRLLTSDRDPTPRQLRQFAVVGLFAIPWGTWLATQNPRAAGIAGAVAAVGALAGWLQPNWLRPVWTAAMWVAAPLGAILGEAALLAVFFLVVTPLAVAMRLVGRDRLQRRFDPAAASYWQPKRPPGGPASYFRQF